MDRLRCVVERITYQNEQNGYSVIKVKARGYNDLVTVFGTMPEVHVGAVLTLTGEWKMDAKYGRQFSMVTFEETLPATVYGIEKYLGSGLVKGIGPKVASRIVKEFGAETLNVIEEDPDSLIRVPGIGKVRVERIKKSWVEQKEIKNIMVFLQSHGVSTSHATKIWKTYGDEGLKVVQENPYRLADDIWGIGFKTADTIADKLGFEKEKFVRLRSGLLYTLNKLSEEGHCYALRDQLVKTGAELLSVEEALLSMTLDEMIRAEDVKVEPIGEGIAIGPLLVIVGKLISAIGSIMTFAPQIVSGVQSIMGIGSTLMGGLQSLWATLLANPITLIIAAIALLVAAFKHLWDTNSDWMHLMDGTFILYQSGTFAEKMD